ncbi:hypothetical protein DASC09_002880 [Saccharomycopsis crataegensis]|uniref:FAS1 domain-containing protein n=1 Tax=Saccharomycopsis crataegensis TaxID=43959 RepID=A0AAV5QDY5_9ASCO|nr:hypothetical protein DASC09_002880 [Saccharomycopsis crataegensis]
MSPSCLVFLLNSLIVAASVHASVASVAAPASSSSLAVNDGDSLTVIDILSKNVEFSVFLRVLQRSGLIPTLNIRKNFTLIAPVNSAFAYSNFEDDLSVIQDNIHQYIINNSFLSSDIEGLQIFETTKEPVNNVFTPITVEVLQNDYDDNENMFTIDGVEVVEPNLIAYSQDSVVHGINQILPVSASTCEFVDTLSSNYNGSFDIFSKLMAVDYCSADKSISGTTLLLPLDENIEINDIELNYLSSTHGSADRSLLVNRNIFHGYVGGQVAGVYKDFNEDDVEFQNLHDGNIVIIDGKKAKYSNVLSDDGIIHIVGEFDPSPVEFTPRKYLYGLNSDDFVDELDFRSLSYLIDDNSISQTLFLFEEEDDDNEGSSFGKRDLIVLDKKSIKAQSSTHKDQLLYHFIDGKIDVSSSGLYDSKVCRNKRIGNNCQKIKINHNANTGSLSLNNEVKVLNPSEKISIANTDIYHIDKEFFLPSSLESAVGSLSRCTTSMKYLNAFNLLDLANNKKGYTVFLPCFSSWSRLDLTLDYLKKNSTALLSILQNGIVNGLVYSDFDEDIITTNLNNELVEIKPVKSDDHENFNKLLVNGREINVERNRDIIFDKGVVQPINGVVIPPHVQITLTDLIKTASPDNNLFLELMDFTNLSHVLNSPNYSVILPSTMALTAANFTKFTPLSILETFLKLHIVPNHVSHGENDIDHDNLFDCGSKIPTLLDSVHLACRPFNDRSNYLQIVEGADLEVRILKTGCSTLSNQSCIFVIDKAILPDWLSPGKKLKFHLPLAAYGVGFVSGIIFIFLLLPCCLLAIVKSSKSQNVADDEQDPESGEDQRLLPSTSNDQHNYDSISNSTLRESIPQPIANHSGQNQIPIF